MKNNKSLTKVFSIFMLLTGILLSSVTYAAQQQVVLFCSSWNLKCREARNACSTAANHLNIGFIDLDIDFAASQQKANALGLDFPSSIPYIYILDNKKVIQAKLYNGETAQELERIITWE
ncbi:MAG: hypothetical protein WCG23_08685 [bacterium]